MSNFKKTSGNTGYEREEELVNLKSKILKILYIVMIFGIIMIVLLICRELKIWSFITKILGLIAPVFVGFIIAWLFNPLVTRLQKMGIKRILATALVYLFIILFIYLFLSLLVPTVVKQINDLISLVPSIYNEAKDVTSSFFDSLTNIEGFNPSNLKDNMFGAMESFATSISSNLPNYVVNIVSALFSGVGQVLMSLVVGFYMLFSFENISDHLYSLFPKKKRYELRILLNEISSQLRKFVNGTLILSGIICVSTTIGFAIIGLEAPLLFGIFCGLTNVIPYIGPYVGGVPAVLVGFSQGPATGILALVILFVIQMLEGNLLNPIIMSKTMKVHPVTIIIGLLIFGYFFGIWGMILATPLIALIKIIVRFIINKYDLFDYDDEPTEMIPIETIKKKKVKK